MSAPTCAKVQPSEAVFEGYCALCDNELWSNQPRDFFALHQNCYRMTKEYQEERETEAEAYAAEVRYWRRS